MSYFPDSPEQPLHAFAFSHLRGGHARLQQKPLVIWLTGISAAGKSTIADALDRTLQAQGRFTSIIDGDYHIHWLEHYLAAGDTKPA